METDFSAVLEAVRAHESVSGRAGTIEVRQTHASVVFLTGSEVFKLKKPVNFGFLDYSTPRRRAVMCHREVSINRRLAPDVYLGVLRLMAAGEDRLQIEGSGPVVDYLVHMRRLDDDASLASLVVRDEATPAQIRIVARRLTDFHAAAPLAPPRYGSRPAARRNVEDNFTILQPFVENTIPRSTFETISDYSRSFLGRNAALFRQRVQEGRIRECHGDLRAEHIYLAPTLEIIDAIEFNRRLQCIDVANDLAFLAMDLDAMGAPHLSRLLVEEYQQASNDKLGGLLAFYAAYRAVVRAKVASLRSAQDEVPPSSRERAHTEALRFAHRAWRYAAGEQRPTLVAMVGLTGAGKSTLARVFGDVLSARVVSADETRKQMAGMAAFQQSEDPADTGLYAPEINRRVYDSLIESARLNLAVGRDVVLDATFRRRADRASAAKLALTVGARLLLVECTAADDTVRSRLDARARAGDPWSDGRWEIYLSQRATFEAFGPDERAAAVSVETELPLLDQVRTVVGYLEQR